MAWIAGPAGLEARMNGWVAAPHHLPCFVAVLRECSHGDEGTGCFGGGGRVKTRTAFSPVRNQVSECLSGPERFSETAGAQTEPLKQAIAQVLGAPWQRCTVHFLREALGHARREQQPMLAALIRPIFNADSAAQARELVGDAIARLERPLPKVAAMLERAEDDLLAFYAFPLDHWRKLRSTNPLERLNREIGRRTDVVGIFPDDASLIRLATSLVIEQNDEWLVGRRYLSLDSLAPLLEERREEDVDEEVPALTPA